MPCSNLATRPRPAQRARPRPPSRPASPARCATCWPPPRCSPPAPSRRATCCGRRSSWGTWWACRPRCCRPSPTPRRPCCRRCRPRRPLVRTGVAALFAVLQSVSSSWGRPHATACCAVAAVGLRRVCRLRDAGCILAWLLVTAAASRRRPFAPSDFCIVHPPCADGDAPRASRTSGSAAEACQRTQFLRDHPELLQRFSTDLLLLMIKVSAAACALGREIGWPG